MTLNYQIALTSVPFDNSYKNVLRFDTRSEQEAYFKVNTLFSNSPEVNFNVGSLYATNVIYDCKENDSINELLNKNYVIVKDNSTTATYKYYYYFVTNAIQQGGERISMSLELDIFQTYYIDLKFSDSTIFKSHLNRFIDNGDGTVSFDGTPTSKLFEREDIQNVAKRMTKRTRVGMFDNSTDIGKWLNENIEGWLYIFVDGNQLFGFNDLAQPDQLSSGTVVSFQTYLSDIRIEGINKSLIPSNMSVLTYPIYKETGDSVTDNRIIFVNENLGHRTIWGDMFRTTTTNINTTVIEHFANNNNGYGKVYSVKYSTVPPFSKLLDNLTYEISEDGKTLSINVETTRYGQLDNSVIINPFLNVRASAVSRGKNFGFYDAASNSFYTLLAVGNQEAEIITEYETTKKLTFLKNEIKNSNKNKEFNPKLLSMDYFSLSISDSTENGFEYDLQKLNKNKFNIKYTEPIVPDISKKYIRIGDNNGVYIKETENNLIGFVNSNDNSILLPTTAFQSMLANNKNYFLQNSINRGFGVTQGLLSGGVATLSGIASSSPLSTIGGGIALANVGLNYAKQRINENLTIDNLKNSPSNIVGAKGNAIFESMYSENGIIVEEWEILDNEKEMINDFMCMYGFTYNRIDNVKNVDNIRKYYNYVRADIEAINGVNISERVHQKFRECFANGVRFWNTDTFSYEKENYERWLDND